MRHSAKAGFALFASAALGLSACGSSSKAPNSEKATPGASGATIIAAAFTKTSAVKSAKLALTYELTAGSISGGAGANERATGSGVFDFARKQADITVTDPTGQSEEERLIGTVAYLRLPPVANINPALRGKTWIREQLTGARGSALGFGSSSGGDASDPTTVLKLVSRVAYRVDMVGTDSVRGATTTHYRATVDFAKASAKSGASAQQVQRIEQLLGTRTFPVDLWIDGQGAARRIQFRFPLPKGSANSAAGPSGQVTETLEFFDFGTPVSVQPPPPSQVTDAKTLPGAQPASSVRG
jgi:hypothetical protein